MAAMTCIECGQTSEDGEGWKAELAVDLIDEVEPDEVAISYPEECWAREFSDRVDPSVRSGGRLYPERAAQRRPAPPASLFTSLAKG